MNLILDGLYKMMLDLEVVTKNDNSEAVIVFAIGCLIIGAIAVLLDLTFYLIRKQSLLNLNHGKNTIMFFFAWSIGAFIMGYVGQLTNIFQVSLMSCVIVGFGWPVLFSKMLENMEQKKENQEPQQVAEVEE